MDVTFLTNVIRHILERDNFVIDFEESDEQNIHFGIETSRFAFYFRANGGLFSMDRV